MFLAVFPFWCFFYFHEKNHLPESFCNSLPLFHILSPSHFTSEKNWLDIYLSAPAWIGTFQTSEVHFDMIYSTYNFTCPWFESGIVIFPKPYFSKSNFKVALSWCVFSHLRLIGNVLYLQLRIILLFAAYFQLSFYLQIGCMRAYFFPIPRI